MLSSTAVAAHRKPCGGSTWNQRSLGLCHGPAQEEIIQGSTMQRCFNVECRAKFHSHSPKPPLNHYFIFDLQKDDKRLTIKVFQNTEDAVSRVLTRVAHEVHWETPPRTATSTQPTLWSSGNLWPHTGINRIQFWIRFDCTLLWSQIGKPHKWLNKTVFSDWLIYTIFSD